MLTFWVHRRNISQLEQENVWLYENAIHYALCDLTFQGHLAKNVNVNGFVSVFMLNVE